MKLIAGGDIYDLPPYAEVDLDALIEWRYAAYKQRYILGVPGLIADAFTAAYSAALPTRSVSLGDPTRPNGERYCAKCVNEKQSARTECEHCGKDLAVGSLYLHNHKFHAQNRVSA